MAWSSQPSRPAAGVSTLKLCVSLPRYASQAALAALLASAAAPTSAITSRRSASGGASSIREPRACEDQPSGTEKEAFLVLADMDGQLRPARSRIQGSLRALHRASAALEAR